MERRDEDWINPPEEKDEYEPDWDSINDGKKLEEEEELDSRYWEEVKEHDCCRGDCK